MAQWLEGEFFFLQTIRYICYKLHEAHNIPVLCCEYYSTLNALLWNCKISHCTICYLHIRRLEYYRLFLLLALYYSDYRDFGISTVLHNANFASPSIKKVFRLQRLETFWDTQEKKRFFSLHRSIIRVCRSYLHICDVLWQKEVNVRK